MSKQIYTPVANRGIPPFSFIEETVAAMKELPDRLFQRNADPDDIYDVVYPQLGPYAKDGQFIPHRKACMCEVLRVLGGFESSWNWSEDYDHSNANEDTLPEMSAGIFQISYDSAREAELKMILHEWNIGTAKEFRRQMIVNHFFAIEYTVQLLRLNTKHNGPIKRREINPWLKRECVEEFLELLA